MFIITLQKRERRKEVGKERREEGRDGGKMSYFIKYSHAELFIAL